MLNLWIFFKVETCTEKGFSEVPVIAKVSLLFAVFSENVNFKLKSRLTWIEIIYFMLL